MMISWRKLRRHHCKTVTFVIVFVLIFLYIWRPSQRDTEMARVKRDMEEYLPKEIKTFLLVLIMTGPQNRDRRDAMRETWLADVIDRRGKRSYQQSQDVVHYFVIGTKDLDVNDLSSLEDEGRVHNDLLLFENFADAYKKLTEKLGITLKWVNKHVDFKYVFKGDDDTYVRLNVIEQELKERSRNAKAYENLYWGYFYGKGNIKKSGPWKETEWKLCDHYLPYARGGGYILSSNVVSYVANNFHRFKQYLSEDVSLGAWLAPLEVERIHDIRFDTEYKSRGCSNTYIVCHKQSIDDMKAKHGSLQKNGKLCEKEYQNFNGYEYNWDVPPSQCCVRSKGIP